MYLGVCVSRCLKEELVLAIDMWLLTVSNIILFETVILLNNKAILKQFCMCCYVVLNNVMEFLTLWIFYHFK